MKQPPPRPVSDRTPTLNVLLHEGPTVDWFTAKGELQRLVAIEQWALKQQPFQPGARVQLAPHYQVPQYLESGSQHGWWVYRDCLHPGARAMVQTIDFNWVWLYWYAAIVLDHEFWMDEKGVRHDKPADHKHYWDFRPEDLVPLED